MIGLYKIAQEFAQKLAANKKDYLYHVTYAKNLPGIASQGLSPFAGGRGLGRGGYEGHSQKKVFLTEYGGVDFWFNKLAEAAQHYSDNPIERKYIPVVLRILENDELEYQEDLAGIKEVRTLDDAEPYFIETELPAEEIEVWNGYQWIPVQEFNSLDLSSSIDQDGYIIFPNKKNPLFPTELI